MMELSQQTGESCAKAERNAIISTCTGLIGEVPLTDSAVIVLFTAALGVGEIFSLLSTSIMSLCNGLFVIPFALFAVGTKRRKVMLGSIMLASIAFIGAILTPFIGNATLPLLMGCIILFAFCHTGFVATWFPMLDSFLDRERRGLFWDACVFHGS